MSLDSDSGMKAAIAGLSAVIEDVNECGIERIPLLASPQGGVAARSIKKSRSYLLFPIGKPPRPRDQRTLREIFLVARPPLLAVMQGGEYAPP